VITAYGKVKAIAKGIRFVSIPGDKPPKWDIADGVKDGMGKADVLAFIKANLTETPPVPPTHYSIAGTEAGEETGEGAHTDTGECIRQGAVPLSRI
jgi:hypothetical protein